MRELIDLMLNDRTPVLVGLNTWVPFNVFLFMGLLCIVFIVLMDLKKEWYGE
jgi:hypothetical protein